MQRLTTLKSLLQRKICILVTETFGTSATKVWDPKILQVNRPQLDSLLKLGVSPEKAPNEPKYITIGFEKGEPVSLDGKKLDPRPIVEELNKLGGAYGVGIADIVEDRLVGMKSRGVYETPGGTILLNYILRTEYLLAPDRDTQVSASQSLLIYV